MFTDLRDVELTSTLVVSWLNIFLKAGQQIGMLDSILSSLQRYVYVVCQCVGLDLHVELGE